MTYDTSKIRQFILKIFDDQEFIAFCFDYFRDVYTDLTSEMRFSRMVQLLLEHCDRNNQMPSLLAALKRERAALYQQEFASVPAAQTAPTNNFQRSLRRNPRQIFISHASADAELAQRLAADLQAEGWAVWIAPDSILPGEKWVEAINRGLAESGLFLLLLTPEAVASRWVTTETNVAIGLEHRGHLKFIPLEIKACEPPPLWLAYQYIAWRQGYDAGWQNLQMRLNSALNPPLHIKSQPRQPKSRPLPTTKEAADSHVQMQLTDSANEALRQETTVALALVGNLVKHFSEADFKSLCFKLNVDYDTLFGSDLNYKAVNLYLNLQRHGRLEELVQLLAEERPNVAWRIEAQSHQPKSKFFFPIKDPIHSFEQIQLTDSANEALRQETAAALALVGNLVKHFSEADFKSLCFKLNVDYDTLFGSDLNYKAVNLYLNMQRHGRLKELIQELRKQRPNVTWG